MRCKPAIVALAFVACGPNVAPVAELGELCGKEAPVKLLDLEEGQYFWSIRTARAGSERIVVEVHDRDPQGDAWYEIGGTTLWSVGSCGEDPRVLATDATLLPWPEHSLGDSDGLVLACMEASGDVIVLDPSGRDEPATLFAGTQCNPWWTEHGALDFREHDEDATLVLYPYPDELRAGPVAPRSLVESVRLGGLQWAMLRDEVLIVSSDDTLLQLGLPHGDVSVEQTGVQAFTATNERIVWEELGSGSIGRVFLRDRVTGEDSLRSASAVVLLGPGQVGSRDVAEAVLHRRPSPTSVDSGSSRWDHKAATLERYGSVRSPTLAFDRVSFSGA
jgi:hypothetical protein